MKRAANRTVFSVFVLLFVLLFVTPGIFAEVKTDEVVAEKPAPEEVDTTLAEEVKFEDIQLPEKGSPEYWVVRSEAMDELTPLLTKKRAEMKKKRQLLADYLLKINKAEEMASAEIEVPDDPALYAKALGAAEGLEQRDIPLPKNLPTWEETAEFAMRFVLYEGYVPVQFDGVEDVQGFVEVCKKKEQYAEKVRKEMRGYVKDCLKMWLYLGTIDQQAACKEWVVAMKLESEKARAAEKAMLKEESRRAAHARREAEKERKFQDAEDRASYRSSRRERVYTTQEDMLRYRQTRLDEHYSNYYRW